MKKVMFSLIGEQTAPNLFLHLHFEPDVHYFLHSNKTTRQAENLATAIGIWADETQKGMPEIPRVLLEDENNWIYVQDVVCGKLKGIGKSSEVILNITSGTKPMNLGVWEARQTHPRVDVVYLDRDLVRHIGGKEERNETLSREPSIRVFLRTYGYEIANTTSLNSPYLELLASTAEVIGENPELRKELMENKSLPRDLFPEELGKKLAQYGFLLENGNTFVCCAKNNFQEKDLKTLENFWGGDWLSLFTWKIIREVLADREVLVGTVVANVGGQQGTNELDVLFLKDWSLWCVECKVSNQVGKNEPFYKIKQVARDVGGTFAVPVMVTKRGIAKAFHDETVKHAVLKDDASKFKAEIIRIVSPKTVSGKIRETI